jgi:proline iminopeptidase
MSQLDEPHAALAMARIECHYFINHGFFNASNQLLDNIDRIRHIPTEIIQGRYDVVCPPKTAWDLHHTWPEATLHIVPNAGHSAFDPANTSVLIEVTDRFAAT